MLSVAVTAVKRATLAGLGVCVEVGVFWKRLMVVQLACVSAAEVDILAGTLLG